MEMNWQRVWECDIHRWIIDVVKIRLRLLLTPAPMSAAATSMLRTICSSPVANPGITAITAANKVMILHNLIIVDRFEIGLSPATRGEKNCSSICEIQCYMCLLLAMERYILFFCSSAGIDIGISILWNSFPSYFCTIDIWNSFPQLSS